MKYWIKINSSEIALLVLILALVAGCSLNKMSVSVEDTSAGKNGSFEIVKDGIPVNWLVYSPQTVPSGDFDISFDQKEFKEGKQSLHFEVRECSPKGSWHSPGIANEWPAKPGETYKVSFWIRNIESEFIVLVGGVSAFEGEYDTIVKSKITTENWKQFEYNYTIPQKMKSLRFELNILQPGSFWIDDIEIVKTH